jgi:Holliday junction resolvasome RuvABC endonuclease subunit
MTATVVGLDISMTATGASLVNIGDVRVGTIKSASIPDATLRQRRDRINRIVADVAKFAIPAVLVVIEGPSYGSSSVGSWDRAWLYGAVVDTLLSQGHLIAVAAPATVKKFAAGAGNADKTAVAVGMSKLWPDASARNDNEWDALALATMGAQHIGLPVPSRAHHADARAKVAWPTLPEVLK